MHLSKLGWISQCVATWYCLTAQFWPGLGRIFTGQETSSGTLPNTTRLSEANIQDILKSHTALWVERERGQKLKTLPKPPINSAYKSALSLYDPHFRIQTKKKTSQCIITIFIYCAIYAFTPIMELKASLEKHLKWCLSMVIIQIH